MDNVDELKSLSDDELLRRVLDLLAQSRRVEWVLVAHIAEVDARRLFAREAWPSMIQYCMGALHLSEGEAYRRIAAARLPRRYPVILSMLEDGRLHLCGIGVLSRHLNDANYEDLLARATHKTKREVETLVAELDPKPDVPPTIRKRPQRKAKAAAPESANELCPGRVEHNAPAPEPAREKPPTVEPLAKARYKRCLERDRLEFHHEEPYGLGGDRSAKNIRLLCKAHDAYMAELDYGNEKMDQYRRSADRVSEPQPTLELCPGTVAQNSTATTYADRKPHRLPVANLDRAAPR